MSPLHYYKCQPDTVLIHWEVINAQGKLFLKTVSLSGVTTLSDELPPEGLERTPGYATLDYFLVEKDASGHWKTLGSLRVTVSDY